MSSTPGSGSELRLGTVLQRARERQGLSARQLSLAAGLSESVVRKVETGACEPTLAVFAAIVGELDLNDREVALLVRLVRPGAGSRGSAAR